MSRGRVVMSAHLYGDRTVREVAIPGLYERHLVTDYSSGKPVKRWVTAVYVRLSQRQGEAR